MNNRFFASQRPVNHTVDTGAKKFVKWVDGGKKPTKKSRRIIRKKELSAALRNEEKARERDPHYDLKQDIKKGAIAGGVLLYVFTYLLKPLLEESIEHLESNHNAARVVAYLPNGLQQTAVNETFFDTLNDTLESKFNNTLAQYGDLNLSAGQRKSIFDSAYRNASGVLNGVKNITGSVKRELYREFKDELNTSFGAKSVATRSDFVDDDLTRSSNLENHLSDPVQITDEPEDQKNPDIYENKIVWDDERANDRNIFMYDLGPDGDYNTGDGDGESGITYAPKEQSRPKIYEDKIVWQDNRNSDKYDIYMYNLSSDIEVPIANAADHQLRPAIYKNKIVWDDDRNGGWTKSDIYMYNLGDDGQPGTGGGDGETRITNGAYPTSIQTNPDIYENKIVWKIIEVTGKTEKFVCMIWDQMEYMELEMILVKRG